MRVLTASLCLLLAAGAAAQDKSQTHEFIGKVGTRSALLVLHATQRPDGSWQVAGEYVVLATLARRYVEGDRSPEIGVTVLKEGTTPILFGRAPVAELHGTWRDGAFKGTRYGPGGQKREDFEFSESFPSMDDYSVKLRCEAKEGRYRSRLALIVDKGRLDRLEWRSIAPDGQACTVVTTEQQELIGGLRFVAGACRVTLRNLGDFVTLRADNCAEKCGAEGDIVPLLIDRRGNCELLR